MEYSFLNSINPDYSYVKDKERSARAYYSYFLLRCLRMFEYKNLPDTIDANILDRYLFLNGVACVGKDGNGDLRVFFGSWGGEQDVYYRPSKFIVSNPHIGSGWQHEYTIFPTAKSPLVDGVLMRNDTGWYGLHPMLSRYSYLMAENSITLRVADVMLRIIGLLSAPSDKEMIACQEYIDALEDGDLKVIGENPFFDGIRLQSPPSNNGSYLTQFIEYQQYLKGSFYNEIGLSANYNMKREAIGKGESTLDEDSLLPLCDNMLLARKEDIAKINELFGTNIEVDFSSAWKENRIEAKMAMLQMASDASQLISSTETESSTEAEPSSETDPSIEEQDEDQSTNDVVSQDGTELGQDESGCSENETECELVEDMVEPELKVLDDLLAESIAKIGETNAEKKEHDAEVSQLMQEGDGESEQNESPEDTED